MPPKRPHAIAIVGLALVLAVSLVLSLVGFAKAAFAYWFLFNLGLAGCAIFLCWILAILMGSPTHFVDTFASGRTLLYGGMLLLGVVTSQFQLSTLSNDQQVQFAINLSLAIFTLMLYAVIHAIAINEKVHPRADGADALTTCAWVSLAFCGSCLFRAVYTMSAL